MAAAKSPFKVLGKSSYFTNISAKLCILTDNLGVVVNGSSKNSGGNGIRVYNNDIDEKAIRMEKAEELVMVLAAAKADAIIAKIQDTMKLEVDSDPTLLITADTVVTYQGTIREKPANKEEAEEFIKGYSGSHAGVVGSVLVTNLKTGTRKGGWEKAEVYFYDIPHEAIHDLIEEGCTLNVAGGLMLEHPLTLPFVETVVGSYDSVMGLSKSLTEKLMREVL